MAEDEQRKDVSVTADEAPELPDTVIRKKLIDGAYIDEYYWILFSGGACNYVDANGEAVHNPGRDEINAILLKNGVDLFDPQIDKANNGRGYLWPVDGPAEIKARKRSLANLYEVNGKSLAAVTLLEIIDDGTNPLSAEGYNPKRIIYFSDSHTLNPAPFSPIFDESNMEKSTETYMREYRKVSVNMRKTFLKMVQGKSNIHIATTREEYDAALASAPDGVGYEITENRLHGDRILSALYDAKAGNKPVVVFLEGAGKSGESVSFVKKADEMVQLQFKNFQEDGNVMRQAFGDLLSRFSERNADTLVITNDKNTVVDAMMDVWKNREKHVPRGKSPFEYRLRPEMVPEANDFVFVGGAGSWINEKGDKVENDARDLILESLNVQKIPFHDAQVRMGWDNRQYEFRRDHPADSAGLHHAQVALVEMNTRSAGFMSAFEVLRRAKVLHGDTVLYANAFSDKLLVFKPAGIDENNNGDSRFALYRQAISDAKNVRDFFLLHASEATNSRVTIITDPNTVPELTGTAELFRINGNGLHLDDLFKAYDMAISGKPVVVVMEPMNLPDATSEDAAAIDRILTEYRQSATDVKQALMRTVKSLYNVSAVYSQKEAVDQLAKLWENRYAQKILETPIGDLHVTLEDPNTRGLSIENKYADLDSAFIEGSPVMEWIRTLGTERNTLIHRPGDIIPTTSLPKDKPNRLRLMHATKIGNAVRFAFGVYEFTRTNAQGKEENLSRVIFFRPPAAAALPIIEVNETGDKYVMLSRQLRDGVAGALSNEAFAGTLDHAGEKIKQMIIRELQEEASLNDEDIEQIVMYAVHELLFVSPGGTPEAIAGFFSELKLPKSRIDEIVSHIKGADRGELVQTQFILLPKAPSDDDLSIETSEAYLSEWGALMRDNFMNDGGDYKTALLMLNLQLRETGRVQDRLNKKHREEINRLREEVRQLKERQQPNP